MACLSSLCVERVLGALGLSTSQVPDCGVVGDGLCVADCGLLRRLCSGRRLKMSAVYVFCCGAEVFYVGRTGDLCRRVYREHCAAHIGGSEGVVRFLMYHLPEICREAGEIEDVVKREEKAKEILRRKLAAYKIVVVPTDRPEELEEKLIKALRPRLNPPRGRR
jgi:predicted GIY-YIG superfamily endonuclease